MSGGRFPLASSPSPTRRLMFGGPLTSPVSSVKPPPSPSPNGSARRRRKTRGVSSPSKSTVVSPSGRRHHHRCLACDRLSQLADRSDSHSLAVMVVKLEAEIAKLKDSNIALAEDLRMTDQRASIAARDLSDAQTTIESLEASVKENLTKLLQLQIESEAVASGVTDPVAARAMAAAESPKRLEKELERAETPKFSTGGFGGFGDDHHHHHHHRDGAFGDSMDGSAAGHGLGDSLRSDVVNDVVSKVVATVVATVDQDKAAASEGVTVLKEELSVAEATRDELAARLRLETERRVEAENAYKYLLDQTAPLRLNFTRVKHDARREVKQYARTLELNAAVCAEFARSLVKDVQTHFGFVPLVLENKVRSVIRQLSTTPLGSPTVADAEPSFTLSSPPSLSFLATK